MSGWLAAALALAAYVGVEGVVPVPASGPTARTVYVTVVDDAGRAVPGLTPADFVVKEGGKERDIASVAPASDRMRLALMVEHRLAGVTYVRQGLFDFARQMCQSADIALFMAASRAEKLLDYTSDPNALEDAIRKLPLASATASANVADSVLELAKQFAKAKPARPVIVLATTERGLATEDMTYILSELAKSKAQFWAVSIGTGSPAFGIGDGPQQSGGRVVPILALPAFSDGLQEVNDDLSSQYLITYTLPEGVKTSERLGVSLKKPGATLRAPSRVPNR